MTSQSHSSGNTDGEPNDESMPGMEGSGVYMACLYSSGIIGIASYDCTSAEVLLSCCNTALWPDHVR